MDSSPADAKSKKKRKSKKKNSAASSAPAANGSTVPPDTSKDDGDESNASDADHEESDVKPTDVSTATSADDDAVTAITNGTASTSISSDMAEATARFDVLVKDRDALREEVTKLRQSLEELQSKHEREMQDVQTQLEETQNEKDTADENYQNLLGKVNTIRSQLGERLRQDAEDLTQARSRIEELEEQKAELQQQHTARSAEVEELAAQKETQHKELQELRQRASLSQQNWTKERDELAEQEAYVREEFESAKQAMHDWEVLAMEERSIRRDLSDKVTDLEDQLATMRAEYERAVGDRDIQSSTVDGLQKAMQEIQMARKRELKELVESSHTEAQSLRQQLDELKTASDKAHAELDTTKKELERTLPFEKEVKEKNLLIGKLRHEAVILHDHLTKALRFLKKGKPEDNVDRQVVTNHLLHFLALDRSDPKKFQILQLIAALLGWSDEQKEQAGLSRPGAATLGSSNSLRLPGTPMLMHKTPSSPALAQQRHLSDFGLETMSPASATGKESLAELWQNFLEQEASAAPKSRAPSVSVASTADPKSPPLPSQENK